MLLRQETENVSIMDGIYFYKVTDAVWGLVMKPGSSGRAIVL